MEKKVELVTKGMKKVLLIIVCAALLFALTACDMGEILGTDIGGTENGEDDNSQDNGQNGGSITPPGENDGNADTGTDGEDENENESGNTGVGGGNTEGGNENGGNTENGGADTEGGNENENENGGNTDVGTDNVPPETDDTEGEHSHDWQSNPYRGIDRDEFYENYTPACCYLDSVYRTEMRLMSGDISEQDQAPTRAEYMPKANGKYIKNSIGLYSEDGNTYFVVDGNGYVVGAVYRGGAYVTLEDVAAYVYAFGNVPANYVSSKKVKPTESSWGIYLRLNHSEFSGSTTKYPYEPKLPFISGCGGDLSYYEIDIGTTGTDCDPNYRAAPYNNGTSITRGAARIVYARFTSYGSSLLDTDRERFVFYTYNHYNDFEEYLNYRGGWGEMFGNITGGGKISSKTDYNPTPYVVVVVMPFEKKEYAACGKL